MNKVFSVFKASKIQSELFNKVIMIKGNRKNILGTISYICVLIAKWSGWLIFVDQDLIKKYINYKEEEARIFKAQKHYENKIKRRLKKESKPRWEYLLPNIFPELKPAFICMVLCLLLSTSFIFLYCYEKGRNNLYKQAAKFMYEKLYETSNFQMMLVRKPDKEINQRIRELKVKYLPVKNEVLPFPSMRVSNLPESKISEALSRYDDLRTDCVEYIKRWAEIFQQLGDLLVKTDKIDEAIITFESVAENIAFDKPILFALGELYKMRGGKNRDNPQKFRLNHEKAITIYDKMIDFQAFPKDPRPYHFAGYSYFQLKEYKKALEYYDKALEIFPDYAKVYFNKALVYREMPSLTEKKRKQLVDLNFEKVLTLTLEAERKQGESNPRVPFTLAVIYAEIGEMDKVLEKLELAFHLNPLYVIRAEKERAFEVFRKIPNSEFEKLLKRFHPLSRGKFGYDHETEFNPKIFSE